MHRKDDSFFVIVFGGKAGGDDENGPAGLFLGLLAIALAMIFFVALLRDAERRQQNYYPQNYSPRSYYSPTPSNPLQPATGNTFGPCPRGL